MHPKKSLPLLVLLAAAGLAPASRAALHREITFENASVSPYGQADASGNNGYWILTDAGVQYKIATKNDVSSGIVRQPVVTTDAAAEGRRGIYMQIDPRPDRKTPGEKCLIDVCNTDTDSTAPFFGDTRAVSFAVMLPVDFEANTSELMLCEWWRNSADVTLVLIPGTTRCRLNITNREGKILRYDGGVLTPGKWHTIALEVTPNHAVNGAVRLWQDGGSVLEITDTTVGLDPKGAGRRYAIDVGLYRPACQKTAKAYFDRILYGDTYADVSGKGVIAAPARPAGRNLALNRPVSASSVEKAGLYDPERAVDGNGFTRWSSDNTSNQQWLCVDMGSSCSINHARLNWFGRGRRPYQLEVSEDGGTWTRIHDAPNGSGGINDITGLNGRGRYIRINGTAQPKPYRCSLMEFEVLDSIEAEANAPRQVTLKWADAARASGYLVKRSTTRGGPYATIAKHVAETSYADGGLEAGREYYYVISAVNAGGESGDSAEIAVTAK
ncbi:MAG: discoidin domain-containing protein [Opitutaceae bacterium]|jgi:hypothetical protein|nr:discoidin domain-containing protein [Opitutaceae bacterium]